MDGTMHVSITLPGMMEIRVTAGGTESKGGQQGKVPSTLNPNLACFSNVAKATSQTTALPSFLFFILKPKTMANEGSQGYNYTMLEEAKHVFLHTQHLPKA